MFTAEFSTNILEQDKVDCYIVEAFWDQEKIICLNFGDEMILFILFTLWLMSS